MMVTLRSLITSVQKAVKVPLIVAGSIDSFERVRRMKDLKVDGFTIGRNTRQEVCV